MENRNPDTESGSLKTHRTSEWAKTPGIDANNGIEDRHASFAQNPPAEILWKIFLLSIPDNYMVYAKAKTPTEWRAFFSAVFPLNVAFTNRSWRCAALDTHLLWSTWFIKLGSPSPEALSMLKCTLKHFISRSGTCMLKPHVYFYGKFDVALACKSIGSLLDCQERWEVAGIYVGNAPRNVPGPVLDFSRLSSLQRFTAHGSVWKCVSFDPGVFDAHVPPSPTGNEIASLRSARLIYLRTTVLIPFLSIAPNLTELVIRVYDDIEKLRNRVPKLISLPRVRRFELFRFSHHADADAVRFSLLQILKFEVLEELTINNLALPQLMSIYLFVDDNGLKTTLSSLRYFRDPKSTGKQASTNFSHLINQLHTLRSLEIHNEYSPVLIAMLTQMTDDSSRPSICPLLEEFTLDGATGRADQFAGLVSARWKAPERYIRSMTFVNCEVSLLSLMNFCPRKLEYIEGMDDFVQEGLQLVIWSTKSRGVAHRTGLLRHYMQ